MVPILSWFVWACVAIPCDLLQAGYAQFTNTKQVLIDSRGGGQEGNRLDLMTS